MPLAFLILLWAAPPSTIQWALARPIHPPQPSHSIQLLLQHLTIAAQATALYTLTLIALPHPWPRTLGATTWALCCALWAADAWLHRYYGLRLQLSYIYYLKNLRLFSKKGSLALTALLTTAAAAAIAIYPWLPTQASPTWLAPLTLLAAVSTICAEALRTHLPSTLAYEWNNRLYTSQVALLQRKARSPAPSIVPPLFAPQCETATWPDPTYPLMRTTQEFTGPKHFTLKRSPNTRPHVVMIFMESFCGSEVGALGGTHNVTPCFDRLAQEGVLWRNFYASGTSTARSALAALYGLPPRFTQLSAQAHAPPRCIGLPDFFNAQGYFSAFFHNGPLYFENKSTFFFEHGFSAMYDADLLRKAYPGIGGSEWGPHDEVLMDFHQRWLHQRHETPTFSALFTVSTHHPWIVPDEFAGRPTGVTQAPHHPYALFLRSMQYADRCLGTYLEALRQGPLADNTVVIVTSDTGQEVLDEGANAGVHYSGRITAAGTRIPLLLWAPGRIPAGLVIDELGSQLDLMPTLLDLFDLKGSHHAAGTSLVRRCTTRQPSLTHCHAPQLMAMQDQGWRYTHLFESAGDSLYDLSADPHEQHDRAASAADRTATYRAAVQQARAFVDDLYERDAFSSHVATPPERLPRAPDGQLPIGYPSTLADVQARSTLLAAMAQRTREESRELTFLRIYLDAPLNDADKLLAAQLQFKVTYQLQYGVLTPHEHRERARLRKITDP